MAQQQSQWTAEPKEVAHFHGKSDVDSSPFSQHHTLGKGRNQAAPGDHVHDSGTPVGAIIMFGGSTAPEGWLICNGAAVGREDYPELFLEIGTTWGIGDGSTTFNIPDLRVRTPIGVGTGQALGTTDGFAETSRNSLWSHSHSHSASSGSGTSWANVSGSTSSVGHDHFTSGTTTSDGSHGHSGSASTYSHNQLLNTATGGSSARLLGPADHSHSISIGSGGSHSHSWGATSGTSFHSHSVSVSDSGHSHSVSTSVFSNGSSNHPTAAVNFIIKA